MVEFEAFFTQLNPSFFSRFQQVSIWFISLTLLTNGGVPLFLTFLTSTKDWKCLTDRCNRSLPLCDQKLTNDDWEATVSKATDTFLKGYNIACGYDEYISIVNSLYFVAFMAGISVGGALSDRYGRKKMLVMLTYTYSFVVILHAVSKTDFRVFALLHTCIGLVAGLAGILFIYQQELTVGRLRNFGSQVHNEMFSMGMLYGAFLSYYFVNFTVICIALAIPALVFNTAIWVWLPESPFWLQSNNRKEEVKETLKYIADLNSIKFDSEVKIKEMKKKGLPGGGTLRVLFTSSKSTTVAMVTLLLSWLTASYCYWGLSFNVGDLIGNLYLNQLLIALIDLINRPINFLGVERYDRKKFLRLCNVGMMITSAVCMIPYEKEIFPSFNIRKISALLGRMIADLYFSTIYLYTSEVLPTVARASGLGICSCIARIGSILSPFVILANRVSPLINFAIIFLLSAACFWFFSFMPETKGRLLPHDMEQMEDLILGRSKLVQAGNGNHHDDRELLGELSDELDENYDETKM